jgi:dephospho-CoA kinase
MIKIGILGDIGSGKSYVANNFGYPVFNADAEVSKLYKKNTKIFRKLKKTLPKFFQNFPIKKNEVSKAILANQNNLKKIIKIVHLEIRKKMLSFLSKNKNAEIVILDVPLLLENKINKENDILVFVQSKKKDILKRLRKRNNYNQKLINLFRNIQISPEYKKNKSQFVIKNDFTKRTIKRYIKTIVSQILQ